MAFNSAIEVGKLSQLAKLKNEVRRTAKKLRGLPKHHWKRKECARDLWDWRAKYAKQRKKIVGY